MTSKLLHITHSQLISVEHAHKMKPDIMFMLLYCCFKTFYIIIFIFFFFILNSSRWFFQFSKIRFYFAPTFHSLKLHRNVLFSEMLKRYFTTVCFHFNYCVIISIIFAKHQRAKGKKLKITQKNYMYFVH